MFSSNYGLDFLEPLISLMTRIFTQIEFLDAPAHELPRIGWRKKSNLLIIYSEIYSVFTIYRLGGNRFLIAELQK